MRFLTAMGKLMLGTPVHGAPVVVTSRLPVSPSKAASCEPFMNQTRASALAPSVVVEMGG